MRLTDASQMINRFRNLDFVFGNDFSFTDRFNEEDGYYNGNGREIATHLTWEANFVPDIAYPRGHRHGPGAHIVILSGEGYFFLWEEGRPRIRIDWRPGSLFVPPAIWFHQHFNP